MPHSKISLKEAADFLHLPVEDLKYLAQRGIAPAIREKGKILFRKKAIKDWATFSLFKDKNQKLGKKHFSPTTLWSNSNENPKTLAEMLSLKCFHHNVSARTKPSILKELTNIALDTYLLTDSELLLKLLKEREEQLSTGMNKGVAIPHPEIHPPYLFLESFMIVAKTISFIPFGSLDGEKTDIFFMPCAVSDEEHIFMLSRLASMIKKTTFINDLRSCDSDIEMKEVFTLKEEEILL